MLVSLSGRLFRTFNMNNFKRSNIASDLFSIFLSAKSLIASCKPRRERKRVVVGLATSTRKVRLLRKKWWPTDCALDLPLFSCERISFDLCKLPYVYLFMIFFYLLGSGHRTVAFHRPQSKRGKYAEARQEGTVRICVHVRLWSLIVRGIPCSHFPLPPFQGQSPPCVLCPWVCAPLLLAKLGS